MKLINLLIMEYYESLERIIIFKNLQLPTLKLTTSGMNRGVSLSVN